MRSSIALAFATIDRPQVAQRLVRSARQCLGDIAIYAADQSRDVEAMSTFYAAHDVRLVRMPYDIGVTASRNRLAREIREDYFVLCDDDFVMGPQTAFDDAVRILESDPALGVIGGRLYDFDGAEETIRNWELFLEYDSRQRILFSIPIYDLAPRARELGDLRYFICDAVMNFCVMRRSMFANGVAWDERFKSNGEHEDFFLNLKLNTPYRVAYLPTLRAFHHHPEEAKRYRRRLRDRNVGWRLFLDKWSLDQHIEYGLGVRTIDNIDQVIPEADARERFFLNPDLSLQRSAELDDGLLVDRQGVIVCIGRLNSRGEALMDKRADHASLMLDRRSSLLMPAPEENRERPQARDIEVSEKYRLVPSFERSATSITDGRIFFRHDSFLRDETDFILWYFRNLPESGAATRGRRLAVFARWTADDGTALVWRTQRHDLDLDPAPHWRPLLLEAPTTPRGARWLRFDLITDGGADAAPLCTGFLSCAESPTKDAFESLALSRLPRDGLDPWAKGVTLAEWGRGARPLSVDLGAISPEMSLLELDQCPGLEALYFENWRGLGRNLVGARLPFATLGEPRRIALPLADWSRAQARAYGFGRKTGLVRLRPRGVSRASDP